MVDFRGEQIELLATSGWACCRSVAELVAARGLPAVTHEYLGMAFSDAEWQRAERAVGALRERFGAARFADEVRYGALLVPDPELLDTRRALPRSARRDQLDGAPADDVVDRRLPHGARSVRPGRPWSLVATVTGAYGLSLGSYLAVAGAPAGEFTVLGVDTRAFMTRQLWGARVLQSGHHPPDCEHNERWTFTLFPGEPLVDGLAESGTVLKGRVRFRLGKPDRGIGSARVAPALPVAPATPTG